MVVQEKIIIIFSALFGIFLIFFVFTIVNNIIYSIRLSQLPKQLKEHWPDKWKELGEPSLISILQPFRMRKTLLRFVKNPGTTEDHELDAIRTRLRKHMRFGIIGMVGIITFGVISFLYLFASLSH